MYGLAATRVRNVCTQLADSSQVRKDPVAAQGDFGYNVEDNFSNVSSRRLERLKIQKTMK
jgi:hypothetical protein